MSARGRLYARALDVVLVSSAAAAARAAGRAELRGLVPTLQAALEDAAARHRRDELDADAGADSSADQWGAGALQMGVDARLDVAAVQPT